MCKDVGVGENGGGQDERRLGVRQAKGHQDNTVGTRLSTSEPLTEMFRYLSTRLTVHTTATCLLRGPYCVSSLD